MSLASELRGLTKTQRSTFFACFLGWTLDAFDYFLVTVCLKAIATDFHATIPQVAEALFWTLAMRPIGAFVFGAMAEKWGRRPTLMVNIVCFSVFGLASALAPTLHAFLICRALFGVAMGGEWGVGAALAFETLPNAGRGFFSGVLQEGYVCGNLLAAAVYGLLFSHLHGTGMFTGWRVLFMIGAAPALLALYLRFNVEESPAWLAARAEKAGKVRAPFQWGLVWKYLPTFLFLVLLMTAFTSFSHGTQDLYPTFLEKDKGFSPGTAGLVIVIGSLGALFGGIFFGTLSEKLGRKRTIAISALLALPMIPLWAWSHGALAMALGGFLMQAAVQGAWGVIPAHLNELSPGPVRAVFPGFAYQLGNLFSSKNGPLQSKLAAKYGFGPVLSGTVLLVAILVAGLTAAGPEEKGVQMAVAEE